MKVYEQLGQKIRKLRETSGWSQRQLAEKLGYESDTAIHLIERGKRKLTLDKIQLLSEIFRVDIKELVEGNTDSSAPDIKVALRAEKGLDRKSKETIERFIDFIKSENKKERTT